MSKYSSYNLWFRETVKVPHKNVSLYMRRLLESAYSHAYEAASSRYQAMYRAGFTAGMKVPHGTRKPPKGSG